jgi:hypothetical protein
MAAAPTAGSLSADHRDAEAIRNEEPARLAHLARYAVRPPVAMERVHESEDGQVLVEIPPDHRTGATILTLESQEGRGAWPGSLRRPGTSGGLSGGGD